MADSGVLALFDDRTALLEAIAAAKRQRRTLTAYAPTYDKEVAEAAAPEALSIPFLTLAGAVFGCVAGAALTIWTTAQWPTLIVSGKPLISVPPYVLIMFELTILLGSLAAVAAFLRRAVAARPLPRTAYDRAFSDAHFGLLIACTSSQVASTAELLRAHGAVEWRPV
jgi:ActD protein